MSSELTDFLTHRRSRIAPHEKGLNRSKARRTKGLTREDMAELTGVSFKWYTLFESGASKGVSRKLAQRVANVLALSAEESHYLLGLLGFADSYATALSGGAADAMARLLHSMDAVAAALYSPLLDMLDCNSRYAAMFSPPDAEAPFGRNMMWRLFFDLPYRAAWLDWPAVALRAVADFKTITAYTRDTPAYVALLDALGEHEDFSAIWNSQASFPASDSISRFGLRLPNGDRIEIETLVLRSLAAPGVHLGTLTVIEPRAEKLPPRPRTRASV